MALFSPGSSLTYHLAPSDNNLSSFHTSFCGVPAALFSAFYSDLFPFSRPPFLCRWHSAVLLFSPTQLRLKHFSPSNALQHISSWMTANLLTLNSSKTEFIGLKNQSAEIHNSSLDTSHSARNLGFIFDEHLTFSDQITSLSKACYYHIRQLRCIRPYLDSSTACTIATSIVHSKLDYCNSFSNINSQSTLSISLSTSFWYQFLYFWLTYSFTHHFFLFWFTTLHVLVTDNLRTKFEMLSCTRNNDDGPLNSKNGSHDHDHAHLGIVCACLFDKNYPWIEGPGTRLRPYTSCCVDVNAFFSFGWQ